MAAVQGLGPRVVQGREVRERALGASHVCAGWSAAGPAVISYLLYAIFAVLQSATPAPAPAQSHMRAGRRPRPPPPTWNLLPSGLVGGQGQG